MIDKPKERDITQVVRYLTNTFKNVTSTWPNAERNGKTKNATYIAQCDFAWLINEIMQGPTCMAQKYISDCNELLDSIVTKNNKR